jgi:hypothetical protein
MSILTTQTISRDMAIERITKVISELPDVLSSMSNDELGDVMDSRFFRYSMFENYEVLSNEQYMEWEREQENN